MKSPLQSWTTLTVAITDLDINLNEIYRNLGFGENQPDEMSVELVNSMLDELNTFCRPETGYLIAEGFLPDEHHLSINKTTIRVGKTITGYLKNCSHFAAFVVTAGKSFDAYCEQLKADGDLLSGFFAYSIGTEVAEAAVRYVSRHIERQALDHEMHYTYSYSPGYCSWHVREQQQLFRLLPDQPCGIQLTDSNLMYPEKSVSGIIGIGKYAAIAGHACDICGMVQCFKRRK